jgi:tRNA dimethylallyltransferase
VHLIDIAEPGYKYSVFEYQRDFYKAYESIVVSGKMPILCGGSGMYINAAVQNYRLIEVPGNIDLRNSLMKKSLPELETILAGYKTLHNRSDLDTKERAIRAIEIQHYYREHKELVTDIPQIKPVFLGIMFERETERARITDRLHQRLKEGLVDEVKKLLDSGISAASLAYYGLEYRYLTEYLTGKLDYDKMISVLNTAIHQFAKRQRTWFRKMEKEGCVIHWIPGELTMERKIKEARKKLFEVV